MRIVYRIIYAICLALGLYLTIDLTHSDIVSKQIVEQGEKALQQNDYSFFISARYYDQNPRVEQTITILGEPYLLLIYNVANVMEHETGYTVTEGFQVILHQLGNRSLITPFLGVAKGSSVEVTYLGIQISSLPIYTLIASDNMGTFYGRDRFNVNGVFEPIQSLEIKTSEQSFYQMELSLDREDFILENRLMSYITQNQNVPTSDFLEVGYSPVIVINTQPQVVRNSIIYSLTALVLTFFIFGIKKRYMGKREVTPGLEKDIKRLEKQDKKR